MPNATTEQRAPLVSVIIPTYNRATMVTRAVESVLAQTFTDYELIVVDDGSTDETEKVLSEYRDHINFLQQPNRGVSAARNYGIRSAVGQLIAFLDSDDLWLPEKLSRQTRFFKHRPEALICQTEEIWIRNGRRVNPKKRHQKLSGDIFVPSLELCLVSPSAVMLRRALFDEIGLFDEALPACEDYDLWLRISSRHPVHLIDIPLIIKQGGHHDQLSRAPGLDRHRVAALKKLIDTGSLNEFQVKKAVDMLQAKCAVYAAGCRKRGKRSEARKFEQLVEDYRPRAIYPNMPP
jgi:glycosyltransferase involved in cell wall biosynthesis